MNKMFTISILTFLLSSVALAGVKVTSLDLTTSGTNGFVKITLDGRSNDLPDVRVNGNVIELTLSNAEKFNAISKHVKGSHLSANSLNGKAVVKAVLPYEINPSNIDVTWKNSKIEVVFPRGQVVQNKTAYQGTGVSPKEVAQDVKTPVVATVSKKTESKMTKDLLSEDYLNKLMKEEKAAAAPKKDVVNVKQAAIAKIDTKSGTTIAEVAPKATASNDSFSFVGYAAKFSIFLAIVLGLFYGIVQLLKKGVFRRGKLGFLNNSQLIEVLSTTYVAPKRSLMIVKAHKQIFLVSNSENGLTFLSEMTDTSGLIKEGEKLVTGSNFDLNLTSAENESETIIKLKENILESSPAPERSSLSKIAVAKDIVKFSDELKKKAKKLKPIEFN